jgi:hypothetical protein
MNAALSPARKRDDGRGALPGRARAMMDKALSGARKGDDE